MKKNRYFFIGMFLMLPMLGSSEIIKCIDSSGKVTFSEEPCASEQQSTIINLKKEAIKADNNIKRKAYASAKGKIVEPTGTFDIKDVVAIKRVNHGRTFLMLNIYPFFLTKEESKRAKNAIISRDKKYPRRLTLDFTIDSISLLSVGNLLRVTYNHYISNSDVNYADLRRESLQKLIKEITIYEKGGKKYLKFEMEGFSKKNYWDISVDTVINNYEGNTLSTDELRKKNNTEGKPGYSINGVVTYLGKPIIEHSNLDVKISVKDIKNKKYVEDLKYTYDKSTSRYEIKNLPSANYNIIASYVQNDSYSTATIPGDYLGHINLDLNENLYDKELKLKGVMQLIKPINSLISLPPIGKITAYKSPITIRWKPVYGANMYRYRVSPASEESKAAIEYFQKFTRETSVTLDLPKGKYTLSLDSEDTEKKQRLDYLIVHGENWSATSFSFEIK